MTITIKLSTLMLATLVTVAIVGFSTWVFTSSNKPSPSGLSVSDATPPTVATFAALEGRPAPDFSLPSYRGDTVTLSALRGKEVVLFFNEGLMCYPGCWNQITAFAKDSRFSGSDVVALSIVTDQPEQWASAVAKVPDLAQATVLFDTSGAVSRAYGVLNLPSSMHPGRLPGHTYVVVDPEGVVRFAKDDPTMGIRNDEIASLLGR